MKTQNNNDDSVRLINLFIFSLIFMYYQYKVFLYFYSVKKLNINFNVFEVFILIIFL